MKNIFRISGESLCHIQHFSAFRCNWNKPAIVRMKTLILCVTYIVKDLMSILIFSFYLLTMNMKVFSQVIRFLQCCQFACSLPGFD